MRRSLSPLIAAAFAAVPRHEWASGRIDFAAAVRRDVAPLSPEVGREVPPIDPRAAEVARLRATEPPTPYREIAALLGLASPEAARNIWSRQKRREARR